MAQVFASSVVFAFAHIIFASALTVLLSFIGGLLLSHTYLRSRSLWLVSIEHAVLGDLIFTVGLGAWFTYVPH
jgi:membrane protease YdiL (CAAX protease family)